MLTDRSQRWRDRRSRYVDGDTVIDPRRYAVDLVAHDTARAFVAAKMAPPGDRTRAAAARSAG